MRILGSLVGGWVIGCEWVGDWVDYGWVVSRGYEKEKEISDGQEWKKGERGEEGERLTA